MRFLFEFFLLSILIMGVVAVYRSFFDSSSKTDKPKKEDEINK